MELLFKDNNPIDFETKELTFNMPLANKEDESNLKLYVPVRNKCMEIIQDRRYSISKRILKIGRLLIGLDESKPIQEIDIHVKDYKLDIEFSYEHACALADWFIENTGTFSEYFTVIKNLYKNEDITTKYHENNNVFMLNFPNFEILFEKALNNNIFYKQFPFQDYTNNFTDEFIALAGKYFIMKYISINILSSKSCLEDLIDLWTKMFRVIAHTGFEKNIMILMKKMKLNDFDTIGKLIQI